MLNSSKHQPSPRKTICNDCAFHTLVNNEVQCTHPLELGANCCVVTFCSSFQPSVEIDSPCVSFDEE